MLVFHGSRLVFNGSGWILRLFIIPGRFLEFQVGFYVFFFKIPGWSLMVSGGFFWIFKVFFWLFFMFFQDSRLISHGSR